MKEMQKEMQDAISRHLPGQVGSVLKDKLIQMEKDAELLASQATEIANQDKKILELKDIISVNKQEWNTIESLQKVLDERDRVVSKKERDQKVFESQLLANTNATRLFDMQEMMRVVFKSPIYKKLVVESYTDTDNGDNYKNSYGSKNTEIEESEE